MCILVVPFDSLACMNNIMSWHCSAWNQVSCNNTGIGHAILLLSVLQSCTKALHQSPLRCFKEVSLHVVPKNRRLLWQREVELMSAPQVQRLIQHTRVVRVSSSGGGGGGSFPLIIPSFPPKRKIERRKEEKERERVRVRERERERERERCMVGEGERVYFCVALQVISIVSYFMTQLFKSTR